MSGCAMAVAGAPEEPAQPQTAKRRKIRAIGLERNLVIHLVTLEAGRRLTGATSATTAFTAAILAIQHGQFAAEILQHHLGRVFLRAVLVGPFAGLQFALDINLVAFA